MPHWFSPCGSRVLTPRGKTSRRHRTPACGWTPVDVVGRAPEQLPGVEEGFIIDVDVDAAGQRVAAKSGGGESVVRIWDLASGGVDVLDAGDGKDVMTTSLAVACLTCSTGGSSLGPGDPVVPPTAGRSVHGFVQS